jgi:uncharacterized protein (DUF362 family)
MGKKEYQVRAVACDHLSEDAQIYEALQRATAPLTRSWDKLKKARRIGIKFNQDWHEPLPQFAGHNRDHVSEQVARATLRLLRENTNADLFVADVSFYEIYGDAKPGTSTRLKHIFDEFDVEYLDANQPPIVPVAVPGGGVMFQNYFLSQRLMEADEMVSVQKMKNHAYMGVTLSLKNLFGLVPADPLGRPRQYYHHLVRMPYMLVDLGKIFKPALNIIDGLVSVTGKEWGSEEGRITNTLVAGDHSIATDACTTHLMGHNPQADWLTPPYHRDRNPLLVAAENGWGTVNLDEIDFESEVQPHTGQFYTVTYDTQERVVSWRRTTAQQGLYYRDHLKQISDQYAGEYILLQHDQVRWHDKVGRVNVSRRVLSGEHPDDALFFKFVDPDDFECETYSIYEKTLAQIKNMGL